jgi:uncharacterized OB-fold protein
VTASDAHDDTSDAAVLRAPLTLEYPFARSTGPVVGAFLTALREGFVVGIRRADGTVLVPPVEYDPDTAEPLTEIVEVADTGVVTTWCWNGAPRSQQPIEGTFAWALIQLDGADTPMLHAVRAGDASELSTGMRVRAQWRAEREGRISDIECFVAAS